MHVFVDTENDWLTWRKNNPSEEDINFTKMLG